MFLLRLTQLDATEITALAASWHPSVAFLAAGAVAWKVARKAGIYGPVQAAYDAVYAAMPLEARSGALFGATQIAGNAALAVALGTRLDPVTRERLSAPWRAVFPDELT
jgi:hypothetical protein